MLRFRMWMSLVAVLVVTGEGCAHSGLRRREDPCKEQLQSIRDRESDSPTHLYVLESGVGDTPIAALDQARARARVQMAQRFPTLVKVYGSLVVDGQRLEARDSLDWKKLVSLQMEKVNECVASEQNKDTVKWFEATVVERMPARKGL